jgi:general secretion pathway protein J
VRRHVRAGRAERGFTLFEAVVGLALMTLILGALASVTGQWLPSWKRGLVRAQRNEQVAIAIDRLTADLSAAEYVSPGLAPLFRGTERGVVFVRSVLGPNGTPGVEIVRISELDDNRGPALVRMRAPLVLRQDGDPLADSIVFADPVVLLRAPFRVGFAYAGPDGKWSNGWRISQLPVTVRFDIQDVERGTVISSATRIHVEVGAPRPDSTLVQQPNEVQPGNGPT